MIRRLIISLLLAFSVATYAKTELKTGSPAPEFIGYGDDGKPHKLSDYRGKTVVLYFYPMDNSPWCTQEAKGFKEHFELFEKNDIAIIGVSTDSKSAHQAFKSKHGLPFLLLSDPASDIFEKYKAKGIFVNSRITYIINPNGTIKHVFQYVTPKTHAQDILSYLGIPIAE